MYPISDLALLLGRLQNIYAALWSPTLWPTQPPDLVVLAEKGVRMFSEAGKPDCNAVDHVAFLFATLCHDFLAIRLHEAQTGVEHNCR